MQGNLVDILEEELNRLLGEKQRLERLVTPTDGCYLEIKKNKGKYVQYYKCERDGQGNVRKSFIKKNEIQIAKSLAQKEFDRRMYADVTQRIIKIKSAFKYYKNNGLNSIYMGLSDERKALINHEYVEDDRYIASWREKYTSQQENDSFKEKYPIETPYYTDNGEHVRSKSEKIIADKFAKEGIPYVYEPICELNRKGLYPDFALLNINNRETIYFEHFGMMDKPEYAASAIRKISKYRELGYDYGSNLLFTFETTSDGLSSKELNNIIHRYLKK